ncbi:two-component response regulator [Tepidanaerobacter acetatoxydans Re1]|uniref:Stage 0 sporulation protein A homolog n=1 Tax=Tepidanaerobacter acetatoxydans (strain DSM 21804 / JCM 16047 / Re1) TaxID=1209989 RepID=F4LWX5_TEPAE|nr:response regulator transcription factor [Tepidanaerobacter acetatoxydans]AEE90953.1 two component transcriptional regulator, winged helix family [Tepidanaerobacter acetatoxydans Re1]CCP25544.1 two-component response regulator [Tepidanaerobacter acetatoxydans Re1]
MSYCVYLVEDDKNLNLVLTSYLQKEGWQVVSFLTGNEAKQAIENPPDLWILDIMLPDIDGYHLLQEIKAVSPQVPIIFISARDADIDRVVGLELGSDDYLAKPFLPRELVIRSRNLLERIYSPNTQTRTISPYIINEASRMVKLNEEVIDLTSKEFDLLLYFVKNQGLAISREQILTNIWGTDYFGSDRVVDDLVRRLRKKMPQLCLETIYGYGYRLVKS